MESSPTSFIESSLDASATDASSSSVEVIEPMAEAGGGRGSWPAAEAIKSTLTKEEDLPALCRKFNIPEEYKQPAPATMGGPAGRRRIWRAQSASTRARSLPAD
ncbi:hypothetical protein ACP70R_020867 [Stipagrostis hirtigluma subsp. patula]